MTTRNMHRPIEEDAEYLPMQRYLNGRLVRAAGHVDKHGMYYPIPVSRAYQVLVVIGWCLAIGSGLGLIMLLLPLPAPQATVTPIGTANVQERPTQAPWPTLPPPAPIIIVQPTPVPSWSDDSGGPDLQLAQQQPAVVIVEQATPTALPEPGEAGFQESFSEPVCASGAFITYLPGHPCHGRNDQPPLPQPGDPGFAASFEEVGE